MSEAVGDETWRDRLRSARHRARLSQEALGLMIEKSKSSVQSWEAIDGNEPSLDDIPRIAAALGVSPAWLAFGEGPGRRPLADETRGFDRAGLENVIIRVCQILDREPLVGLTPERRASIYLAVYDIFKAIGDLASAETVTEGIIRIVLKAPR